MNRRSFFKTLAAIAAAIFAPRVAVQAKADGQGERIDNDFVRDDALGARWSAPASFKINSCRTLIGMYEFYPPVDGGHESVYYVTNSNPTDTIEPDKYKIKIWETFMGYDADEWPVKVGKCVQNQPDAT